MLYECQHDLHVKLMQMSDAKQRTSGSANVYCPTKQDSEMQ